MNIKVNMTRAKILVTYISNLFLRLKAVSKPPNGERKDKKRQNNLSF